MFKPTLVSSALCLALAVSTPAFAASAAQPAAAAATTNATTDTTTTDATGDKTASTPAERLKARIAHIKALWSKIKSARASSKRMTKAEIAKMRADLVEARAEAKAGKNMVLTGMINKAEKDLEKVKPVDADK